MIYVNGAIAVNSNNLRRVLLGALLLDICGIAYLLNSWSLMQPPYFWIRLAIPSLLAAGFVGIVLNVKFLQIAGKVGGWLFLLVVLRVAVPDWDAYSEAGKNLPRG